MTFGKSMKKIGLSFLTISLVLLSLSCKKEKSPELIVTVVDNDNVPVRRVWVKSSVDGADAGILNAQVLDSAQTDDFGKAFFKFNNTALIDLALYDLPGSTTIIDSTSILVETKRLRGKTENIFQTKLVFR